MAETPTDRDLLRAFAEQGSEEAFEFLVQRHVDLVFATACRRLGDPQVAQEVTQNVFIALARKASWLRGEIALGAWLHRTAMLEARRWWRGEYRRQRRQQAAFELGNTMKDDDSLLRALAGELDEGLLELREEDRQALLLRYFNDRSFREVGHLLGIGEDAARKRVEKALDQLTRFFRRQGYAVLATALTVAAIKSAACSAPVGLAGLAAKAAVATASSAVSVAGLSLAIAKFMGLTKPQTFTACLVIAAGPMAYQWHTLSTCRVTEAALQAEIQQSRAVLEDEARQLDRAQRRLRVLEDALALTRKAIDYRLAAGQATQANSQDAGYLWSEHSDYVRLPKSITERLTFEGPHKAALDRDPFGLGNGPVAIKAGSLSDALAAALNITSEEEGQLGHVFDSHYRQFAALQQSKTFVTNQAPAFFYVGQRESMTVVTTAFPVEGEALKEGLRSSLEAILGSERMEVVWSQGRSTLSDQLNDFGHRERIETLALGPGQRIEYWRARRKPNSAELDSRQSVSGLLGNPDWMPEVFQTFFSNWKARLEADPKQKHD